MYSNMHFFTNSINPLLYTVSVSDTVPPTVTFCPQPVTVTTPFGTLSTIATWAEPTATDDCPGVPMRVQSHSSGADFPVGVTQVTYIFTDAAGNDAFCQFTVTGNTKSCIYIHAMGIFFLFLQMHIYIYIYIYLVNLLITLQ